MFTVRKGNFHIGIELQLCHGFGLLSENAGPKHGGVPTVESSRSGSPRLRKVNAPRREIDFHDMALHIPNTKVISNLVFIPSGGHLRPRSRADGGRGVHNATRGAAPGRKF